MAQPGNSMPTNFDLDFGDLDLVMDDGDEQGQDFMDSASGRRMSIDDDGTDLQETQPSNAASQKSASSAVTDFTRRRNWTQRILAEMKDMLVVLSADGRVLYTSPATMSITDVDPRHLGGQFLSDFIHDDDRTSFIREFNESIATGHRLRYHFRFKRPDGEYTILEASGHPHMANEKTTLGTGKEGIACNGFFLICRPYPTESTALLDSFLEHKVENIRLTRRIADLKKEEEEELRLQQQWIRRSDNSVTISPEDENDGFQNLPTTMSEQGKMLPPSRPSVSTSGQEGYGLVSSLDGNIDTVSRSDASSVVDGIEMLTGLRYAEGERSRGLSTGARDGGLVQGPIGHNQLSTSSEENDKKKKIKTIEEYVCTDCGTLASPEWRKGPSGPKTLCNACGLRWAKKERKRQGSTQISS
ncbi:GATA transcription factor LreB [Talaromyces proteolyticus]|uniref:GATA transcription factor LreB n=1 Tax=Talaromyces proteolyticus TaxID=1131652 RepID=A0AAD4KQ01_9EURO|nr:GATA transcription factor LreB [Talaromyces proteolyticus]KAH8697733.1 GATA transcription factor LreB [Talaromyces proteolyticus]